MELVLMAIVFCFVGIVFYGVVIALFDWIGRRKK